MLIIYKSSVFALAFFSIVLKASCLHLQGRLKTNEDWTFLSRFCFLSDIGRMQFKFTYPFEDCCHNVLLYFDDGLQWPKVYQNDSMTCLEKEAVLESENNQIINLTTRYSWSGCELTNHTVASSGALHCDGGRSFRSMHERWWYIAISNCQGGKKGKGIDLLYEMKLTNGNSFWTEHFSADEFGVLETNIFFLIVFTLMFVASVYVAVYLANRQLFHATYKMFMICLALEVFSLLMLCVALGTYASDGVGSKGIKLIGQVLGTCAEMLFLLLLLLVGKGFTITRGQLSYSGTIKLSVFTTIYAVINVVLFLYEYVLFDPGRVLYVYESPAGHGVIALRLIAWVWFTYGVVFTLKHYQEKNGFYYPLYTIYSIWFYALPIMVLVATYAIPRYMRSKVVNGWERCIDFMAYAVFLTLTRPRAASRNFPYHVRTTQVDVAVVMSDGKTRATANFPHSVYAETTDSNHTGVFNLFTVNNTITSHGSAGDNIPTTDPPPYPGPASNDHRSQLDGGITLRVDLPVSVAENTKVVDSASGE